jgi:hypothetical protein
MSPLEIIAMPVLATVTAQIVFSMVARLGIHPLPESQSTAAGAPAGDGQLSPAPAATPAPLAADADTPTTTIPNPINPDENAPLTELVRHCASRIRELPVQNSCTPLLELV